MVPEATLLQAGAQLQSRGMKDVGMYAVTGNSSRISSDCTLSQSRYRFNKVLKSVFCLHIRINDDTDHCEAIFHFSSR